MSVRHLAPLWSEVVKVICTNAGRRLFVALLSTAALVVGILSLIPVASADSAPANPATPTTVSADALPTVQIDGVAWDQKIVGNTVYVAGKFNNARPAGAAAGTQQTARRNLLAYNLTTGALITSFVPDLNAQALALAVSPDGTRLYVGGDFTTANGQARNRIAAYNTATGALVTTFSPASHGQVRAIAATNTTVYIGGNFNAIGGGLARKNLAAFNAANGAALSWAPITGSGTNANGSAAVSSAVQALAVTGGGSRVVAAGRFGYLNGTVANAVGALDPVSGATLPFAISQVLTNRGDDAAILSLSQSPDGASLYGTGYDFYGPGNLEGTFKVDAVTGAIQWIQDCHGDHYQAYSTGSVVYTATHAHVCSNIGGFPEQDPRVNVFAQAFSNVAAGTVGTASFGNANFQGQPAPGELAWNPIFTAGSVTGQNQAGWAVTGNSQYVVYGGEFRTVNGVPQTGLVRFAIASIAPNKIAPYGLVELTPTVTSLSAGTARVTWQATHDRDNENLIYRVIRNGNMANPVFETTAASRWWYRPQLGFIDRGLTPGQTYSYRIFAYDPFGNSGTRDATSVVVSSTGSVGGAYADAVIAGGAQHFWRLGESSANTAYDYAGFDDLVVNGNVTRGSSGAIVGDSDAATDFSGNDGSFAATQASIPGPNTFSIEAWFNTTTNQGGKIVGFGNSKAGTSSNYDRHVFMDGSGRILFGVYPGDSRTVQSSQTFNNGVWHHVVATLGTGGMALYVDGTLVGSRTDTTFGQGYSGYWRIGGDTSWSGAPFFDGVIDDVSIYPTVLTYQQVSQHYDIGTAAPPNVAPTASFSHSDRGRNIAFDGTGSSDGDGLIIDYAWNFGDGSIGTGATSSHRYPTSGTYVVTLTVTDNDGATHSTSESLNVSGPPGSPYSNAVLDSGASNYWRLAETTGSFFDTAGFSDLSAGSGITRGQSGALAGDPDLAAHFNGTGNGLAATQTAIPGPNVFSVELWFNTTTTAGGKVFGFGNTNDGNSSSYDRHIYLDSSGRLYFGVYTGDLRTLQSAGPLNNGAWHHIVATLGPGGMTLYVDGTLADQRSDTTFAQAYNGYWRIGGDSTWAGTNYFNGSVDDVSVYPSVLGGQTAADHYSLGSTAPPVNAAPTADFSAVASGLDVDFDASDSDDTDGTIDHYAWDFGDGTTDTGLSVEHSYAQTGSYLVTLTVTDDDAAAGTTTQTIGVVEPNAAPTAVFSTLASNLTVTFDGSTSGDSDGTIDNYSWDFGDGFSGSGVAPSHTYGLAGTYSVTLVVTDDDDATGTMTASVSVNAPPPPNVSPTARFESVTTNLSAAFNASTSSDSDGTVNSYSWDFGDGTTGTGVSPTHPYAVAGTYQVILTVTDDDLATGTVSHPVTVTAPPPGPTAYAQDDFGRTLATGLGTADIGGPWTVTGGAAGYSVANSAARFNTPVGVTRTGYLNTVSATNQVIYVAVALNSTATGGGDYLSVAGRHVGTTDYRARLKFLNNGAVQIQLSRVVSGAETVLQTATLAGLTYSAGQVLRVRFELDGTSPTTLRAKAWPTAAPEPAAWQVTATDNTGALQGPGGIGLANYQSGTASGAIVATFDQLWAGPIGSVPGGGPPPNVAPHALFSSTVNGLAANLDANASTDGDGQVMSYAWNFGDSTTGSGVTASHTYALAGTYTVVLTVTDDDGATGTVSAPVTVTGPAPPTAIATDGFGRTVTGGLGTADMGGPYTLSGGAANFSVTASAGQLRAVAGRTLEAGLSGVSARDVAVQVAVSLDKQSTATGNYVSVIGRQIGTSDYRVRLRVLSTGVVNATLFRVVGGTYTSLQSINVPSLSYAPGQVLNVRLDLSGANATTLRAKVWPSASAEPATWLLTATDSQASLQGPGAVGFGMFVPAAESNGPITARFDNLWAGIAGTAPPP